MKTHPSHKTHVSVDASSYDEICEKCGATDGHGGTLHLPCSVSDSKEKAMISKELELAYLELEIEERNLDVCQAKVGIASSQAQVEYERLRTARAINAERRAKIDLRRLHEKIEQLKRESVPVAQAEPADESCVLSKQAYEDLKLVRCSIGDTSSNAADIGGLMGCWFNLLSEILGIDDDVDTVRLPQDRKTLLKRIRAR